MDLHGQPRQGDRHDWQKVARRCIDHGFLAPPRQPAFELVLEVSLYRRAETQWPSIVASAAGIVADSHQVGG
ncbi:hypothetical protein [Streptomyces mesophilus]|uniref:hypothetical protein n=1 Tax=Streptomyces mesophilus TaxID=1775132 RepID=UPI002E2853E4|nr:hypothetical protein [Streptomyces mesophilus]